MQFPIQLLKLRHEADNGGKTSYAVGGHFRVGLAVNGMHGRSLLTFEAGMVRLIYKSVALWLD